MSVLLPPSGQLDQGSVLDGVPWNLESPPLGIALSNTCDFEHDKADFVILAALKPAKEIIQSSSEFRNKLDGAQDRALRRRAWESLLEILQDFLHNNSVRRYFFLDGRVALDLDPLLVDFQQLVSVPVAMARSLPHMATLPSPDREKLVVHFASYTSRIGTDRQPEGRVTELTELLTDPYHGPDQA
jgi:hypothetical protein